MLILAVVELSGLVVPVEAKAALNLKAKSLKSYRERFAPPLSVRTSLAGLRREPGGLLDLPLFAVSRLPALAAEASTPPHPANSAKTGNGR